MRIVVDASVVVAVCLADGRLGPLAGHELHAPWLVASETTSALSELVYRREVPPESGISAVDRLTGLEIRMQRPADLSRRAWAIAQTLGWAKTHDAEYVALAEMLECPLVTLDGRLARGVGRLVAVIDPVALRG